MVTLASQFEVTEESFYGIRIPEFRTVGALKVRASSSALITCYKPNANNLSSASSFLVLVTLLGLFLGLLFNAL